MEYTAKAIFLDMDGTILNHENRVSVRTKEVIDKLREKGILVFIATEEHMRKLKDWFQMAFK